MLKLMNQQQKSMDTYSKYDALAIENVRLLTLVRVLRGSYLHDQHNERIVLQTEIGLKEGKVLSKTRGVDGVKLDHGTKESSS
jgi:hypothetical protein